MNASNAKDYLPLVQALADGKVIQINTEDGWEELKGEISLCFGPEQYRIKHEPREIWYNRSNTGVESGPYESKKKAIEYAFPNHTMVQVCYREVIE